MYTTLNAILEHHPCTDGLGKLLKHLGKIQPDYDEPLSLLTILDAAGFEYTLRCFCAVEGFEKEKLLLGITYAREVEHLMPAESKKALDVFERYANGLATEEEFEAARRCAYAAYTAADAAHTAYAARAAAWAAARAADADAAVYWAACAARAAAARAAYSTIKAKQETQLRELLERTCTQP